MTIMLYGFLGKQFGKVHQYDVKSPAEAVKALSATIEGFKQTFIDGGYYKVLRAGKDQLTLEQSIEPQSDKETIRIVPVVSGAGRGLGSIVLGAALIWATGGLAGLGMGSGLAGAAGSGSLFVAGSWATSFVSNIGFSLILGGVSQMLFSPPDTSRQTVEAVSNRPSFSFDGAVNTAAQGNPVPICYGKLLVGSQIISAGLTVEQI